MNPKFFLVKFNECDLLVEDLETVERVKKYKDEIIALYNLTIEAMQNFMDLSYKATLKEKSDTLKAKFSDKFVFGVPFDARSGELYALDKRIAYTEVNI